MNTLPEAWKPFTKEPDAAPVVTAEQLELVKRTVATGATVDELKLYLYDCQRQGVHPLDKLIHFTKRSGKYTPITSIDFMRTRAADTGEYAGSDDAVFARDDDMHHVEAASVTVWRFVQGQRCPFTATARWSEYKPEQNDFMWKRMPHTMLAKCAEALALRKGFPRQLAGLYAREEMDQAGPTDGYSVEAPIARGASEATPSEPNGGDSATSNYRTTQYARAAGLPRDALTIQRVDTAPTKNPNVTKARITLSTGEVVSTINSKLATLCEAMCQEGAAVEVKTKETKWGTDLVAVHRVDLGRPDYPSGDNLDEPPLLDESDIGF